jgi:hypothetical protein
MAATVFGCTDFPFSKFRTELTDTFARAASSSCDQENQALTARHCAEVRTGELDRLLGIIE